MLVAPRSGFLGALGVLVSAGCLAANPAEDDGSPTTGDTGMTETGVVEVPPESMLGCPAGETCPLLFVAQTFDDRIEVFAPEDATNAFRGTIRFDLRPGTDADSLDEPFGIALSNNFLHIVAGHYPTREQGTLVSIPRLLLGTFDAPADVPVGSIVVGNAFVEGVVPSSLGVPEPIFMLDRPLGSNLVIGSFNNDLFSTEDLWTAVGQLHFVDVANPANFAVAELGGLGGEDCLGAAEIVTLEDDVHGAVACDGNEAVAFVDLPGGATPQDAAAGVTGKICELPPLNDRRVRYLAFDGDTASPGAVVGLGPGFGSQSASGEVYSVKRSNCELNQVELGQNGQAHPAEIVARGSDFLVASGSGFPDPKRGIYVLTGSGFCADPIPGFTWDTPGEPNNPYALALDSTQSKLAVGAGPFAAQGEPMSTAFGAVLWATLSGSGCDTTATVVDLTDGAPGHASVANPADATTLRRAPNVVVIAEVSG